MNISEVYEKLLLGSTLEFATHSAKDCESFRQMLFRYKRQQDYKLSILDGSEPDMKLVFRTYIEDNTVIATFWLTPKAHAREYAIVEKENREEAS